jgi:uncharacterized protein
MPDSLDPWRAARSARVFSGDLDAVRLPRLAAEVGAHWPGRFELRFGRDPDGRAVVNGFVRLTLRLTCQRCMGEMDLPVDAEIAVGLLHTDVQSDELPDALDPVVVGDDPMRPWDLLEDELLLAIPHVPRHPAGTCPGTGRGVAAMASAETSGNPAGEPARENPFAVLAALRSAQSGETGED